jgi:hypothetical protein
VNDTRMCVIVCVHNDVLLGKPGKGDCQQVSTQEWTSKEGWEVK